MFPSTSNDWKRKPFILSVRTPRQAFGTMPAPFIQNGLCYFWYEFLLVSLMGIRQKSELKYRSPAETCPIMTKNLNLPLGFWLFVALLPSFRYIRILQFPRYLCLPLLSSRRQAAISLAEAHDELWDPWPTAPDIKQWIA